MKRISDLKIGEAALVDIRAICRDPEGKVRISLFYEAIPLEGRPPTGIVFAYLERWLKNEKSFYKLYYPEVMESIKEIPLLEWPDLHQLNAVPVSVIVPLERTKYKSILESLPEFPCRICKFRDQEKNDICTECNRIMRYYMGICIKKYPKIPKRILRETLIKKLGNVKYEFA